MKTLSGPERDAVAHLLGAPSLERTIAWSRVNSGTYHIDGLARVADLLADAFSALGHVELIAGDPVDRVTADGRVEPIEHGKHLHLVVRREAPVQMLFTGHMDTVYPEDHPFQQVTTLADGRVNGPGVADMKGGLALLLAALEAIEAVGVPELGYEVLINSDEETGSLSSRNLIEASARGKLAALTYEPALADGTLAEARGGTGNFSLVVRGRSAHAGRNPEDGRNAVVAAADLAVRLAAAKAPGLTVNPARIEGGGPNNVVPDLAVLRINFRPASHGAIARAQATLDAAVAEVAAAHDVTVEVHGSFNRPPKPLDRGAERLLGLVRDAGDDLGLAIRWQATGGVCDGNNIAACGVPVIDTMGARGGAIHSAEEFLIPDSLHERAALSALTILRIAKGEFRP